MSRRKRAKPRQLTRGDSEVVVNPAPSLSHQWLKCTQPKCGKLRYIETITPAAEDTLFECKLNTDPWFCGCEIPDPWTDEDDSTRPSNLDAVHAELKQRCAQLPSDKVNPSLLGACRTQLEDKTAPLVDQRCEKCHVVDNANGNPMFLCDICSLHGIHLKCARRAKIPVNESAEWICRSCCNRLAGMPYEPRWQLIETVARVLYQWRGEVLHAEGMWKIMKKVQCSCVHGMKPQQGVEAVQAVCFRLRERPHLQDWPITLSSLQALGSGATWRLRAYRPYFKEAVDQVEGKCYPLPQNSLELFEKVGDKMLPILRFGVEQIGVSWRGCIGCWDPVRGCSRCRCYPPAYQHITQLPTLAQHHATDALGGSAPLAAHHVAANKSPTQGYSPLASIKPEAGHRHLTRKASRLAMKAPGKLASNGCTPLGSTMPSAASLPRNTSTASPSEAQHACPGVTPAVPLTTWAIREKCQHMKETNPGHSLLTSFKVRYTRKRKLERQRPHHDRDVDPTLATLSSHESDRPSSCSYQTEHEATPDHQHQSANQTTSTTHPNGKAATVAWLPPVTGLPQASVRQVDAQQDKMAAGNSAITATEGCQPHPHLSPPQIHQCSSQQHQGTTQTEAGVTATNEGIMAAETDMTTTRPRPSEEQNKVATEAEAELNASPRAASTGHERVTIECGQEAATQSNGHGISSGVRTEGVPAKPAAGSGSREGALVSIALGLCTSTRHATSPTRSMPSSFGLLSSLGEAGRKLVSPQDAGAHETPSHPSEQGLLHDTLSDAKQPPTTSKPQSTAGPHPSTPHTRAPGGCTNSNAQINAPTPMVDAPPEPPAVPSVEASPQPRPQATSGPSTSAKQTACAAATHSWSHAGARSGAPAGDGSTEPEAGGKYGAVGHHRKVHTVLRLVHRPTVSATTYHASTSQMNSTHQQQPTPNNVPHPPSTTLPPAHSSAAIDEAAANHDTESNRAVTAVPPVSVPHHQAAHPVAALPYVLPRSTLITTSVSDRAVVEALPYVLPRSTLITTSVSDQAVTAVPSSLPHHQVAHPVEVLPSTLHRSTLIRTSVSDRAVTAVPSAPLPQHQAARPVEVLPSTLLHNTLITTSMSDQRGPAVESPSRPPSSRQRMVVERACCAIPNRPSPVGTTPSVGGPCLSPTQPQQISGADGAVPMDVDICLDLGEHAAERDVQRGVPHLQLHSTVPTLRAAGASCLIVPQVAGHASVPLVTSEDDVFDMTGCDGDGTDDVIDLTGDDGEDDFIIDLT